MPNVQSSINLCFFHWISKVIDIFPMCYSMDKDALIRPVEFYKDPEVTHSQFESWISDELRNIVLWPDPYPFQSRNDAIMHYMFEFL